MHLLVQIINNKQQKCRYEHKNNSLTFHAREVYTTGILSTSRMLQISKKNETRFQGLCLAQHRMVGSYQHFRTTCRACPQASSSPRRQILKWNLIFNNIHNRAGWTYNTLSTYKPTMGHSLHSFMMKPFILKAKKQMLSVRGPSFDPGQHYWKSCSPCH